MSINSHPLDRGGAFYIDEVALKAIVGIVVKFTESKYSISASFEDEFSHRTGDLSSLVTHPHFRASRCNRLTISSSTRYSDNRERDVQITFRDRLGYGAIIASISSNDDNIHIIRAEIDREIKSLRTKYDVLYRVPWVTWYIFGTIVGIALGVKISDALTTASQDQSKDAITTITGTAMGLSIFTLFVVLYVLGKLKLFVYPCMTIAIGKDKDRFSNLQDTRKWAYRAIVVALIGLFAKKFYGG